MFDTTFQNHSIFKVFYAIKNVDAAPVECDGATNLVSHYLTKLNIPHQRIVGKVFYDSNVVIPLHYWTELNDDNQQTWIIDLRCRMWLQNYENVPHGIFCKSGDFSSQKYLHVTWTKAPGILLPDEVVKILLMH